MSRENGMNWGKKAYLWLSLATVAVIWLCFFGSLLFGRLSHGPVEDTWLEEVGKWLVMTPILVVIVDVIAYAWIGTVASRKAHNLEAPKPEEKEEEEENKE